MGILSGGLQATRQSQPGRAKMCPILLNPGFSKIGSIFAGLAGASLGWPWLARLSENVPYFAKSWI